MNGKEVMMFRYRSNKQAFIIAVLVILLCLVSLTGATLALFIYMFSIPFRYMPRIGILNVRENNILDIHFTLFRCRFCWYEAAEAEPPNSPNDSFID